jgi:predicted permease
VRRLRKAPGFSVASIVTLALGIGANSAIFSAVYGVAIRPLPYSDSDQLVWLDHSAAGINVDDGLGMTTGLYVHYRARSRTLEEIAVYKTAELTVTGEREPERVPAALTTAGLSDVLRVPPALGRWIREDDDRRGGTGVVVLSHALWSRRFGGDANAIGRAIRIDGVQQEIIGVMPEGFGFPESTQMWMLHQFDPTQFGGFSERGVGRLVPGAEPQDAQAEIASLIPQLPDAFDQSFVDGVLNDALLGARIVSLKESVVGDVRQMLWVLLGTVGFVLFIACTNVANLFLVRAEGRHREVALRTAIGASRADLVRYFLAESLVLAALGGAMGLGLAYVGVELLLASAPPEIPRLDEVRVDGVVVGFTAAVAILASAFFGCMPLLRRQPDPAHALREGGRTATTHLARTRTRRVLAVVQVALALVLLIGSGLMMRSFWHLKNVDPGFEPDNVLTFQLGLPESEYGSRERAASFYHELMERIRGLPGVESVGAVSCLPLSGWCGGDPLSVEGRQPEPGVVPPIVALRTASAGYFETTGIRLISGRTLTRIDHQSLSGAVVVSQELANRYWPDEDPLGQRVYPGGVEVAEKQWYTVVGLVGDVPARSLVAGGDPTIYFPMLSRDNQGYPSPHNMTVTLRTSLPTNTYVPAVRELVREMDPSLPVTHVRPLSQLVDDAGLQMSFTMFLLSVAAVIALVLGAVGVYGVISYAVAQRRTEFGVRFALGARSGDVHRLVMRETLLFAALGVAGGLLGAFGLTRSMEALLFGVASTDALTFGAVAILLTVVVLAAGYLPARRASRVPPMDALRVD